MNDDIRYINIYSDMISRSFMGDMQENIFDAPTNASQTFNHAHIKYKKCNVIILMPYQSIFVMEFNDGASPFNDG